MFKVSADPTRHRRHLTDNSQQGSHREQGTPLHSSWSKLDIVDGTRGATQNEELDIVNRQLDDAEEAACCTRKALKDDEPI